MYFEKKDSDSVCTVRELKKRELPVYLYGAGTTAKRVRRILEQNGIDVCNNFIDDDFSGQTVAGIDRSGILSFEDVMKLPEADVVIGFYQFGIAYEKIKSGKLCNRGRVFFVNDEPLFDYGYYAANREKFEQTYDWLADDLSRETMRAYMDGRMNGVCRPMAECYVPNQYFIPEITFGSHEVYIDCGMYDGDTILEFSRRCPEYAHIIGFEPDRDNIEKFRLRGLELDNLTVHNKGVWSKEALLGFSADGARSSSVVESEEHLIPVASIDSLDLEEPVTFIKMDIEGSELEALKGAERTIRRDMPKLAVCVYHKKEDMITIPQYIKSLESPGRSYTLLLRHHSSYIHETVLYAIPTVG